MGEKLVRYIAESAGGLLGVFLDDGRVEMDSATAVENMIRPVMPSTRKNALFAGHDEGAAGLGPHRLADRAPAR
jgi:hypothetical protein